MSERQLFIVGEGIVALTPNKKKPTAHSSHISTQGKLSTRSPHGKLMASPGASNKTATEFPHSPLKLARAFRYGRIFPRGTSIRSKDRGLSELGLAMHRDTADPKSDPAANSNLPAGYTYLGQFITHDITFDKTVDIADGELAPKEI